MKKSIVVFVCILALFLTACGTSASSTVPPSSLPESSESIPPQVSSVVVESEPEPEVDPAEETNALLQSGLWGFDSPGEIFSFVSFYGDNEFFFFAAPWVPTEPYSSTGEYSIEGNTVTAIESTEVVVDGAVSSPRTFVFELSDGTFVQQPNGDGFFGKQHTYTCQPYLSDVDYYGFSPRDWKVGNAEQGLRLRAEPNTDAEILREVNEQVTQVRVLGVSQVDPEWRLICYGSTIGFAHGDYIAVQ